MFRRTKIVATVGPGCESEERLVALMEAGTDVFRLNFSHGNQAGKAVLIGRIRDLSRRRQQAVAILGDLQGPKIRVGLLKGGALELVPGREVTITTREVLGEGEIIPTTYKELPRDVREADRILLDDGLMELKVLAVAEQEVLCRVLVGGILKDRKGINLPGVKTSAPALTEKDREDLRFCIREAVDYIAISFVSCAADVLDLKDVLSREKADIPVIAKIERPQAVTDFDAILEAADGVMVARGDLGVEMSPEKVPLIQKKIIRKCNEVGKPVITATQMLESMVDCPRPTRAETSDVANAILDGTDAVMLSEETAVGNFPVEAVSLMVRVALDVEGDSALREKVFHFIPEARSYRRLADAIGQAACRMAESIGAAAILAFTQTGSTAALVAKYRPDVPIFAVTPSHAVRRRLALYAGVRSIRVDIKGDTEAQIRSVEEAVLSAGVLKKGDVAVITMGSPLSAPGTTNLIKVHRLGARNF